MKVYLLFEWVEEREAKIHHGIYSSVDLAKLEAELDWERECDENSQPHEPLKWRVDKYYTTLLIDGDKSTGYNEDMPYTIEEFELDG